MSFICNNAADTIIKLWLVPQGPHSIIKNEFWRDCYNIKAVRFDVLWYHAWEGVRKSDWMHTLIASFSLRVSDVALNAESPNKAASSAICCPRSLSGTTMKVVPFFFFSTSRGSQNVRVLPAPVAAVETTTWCCCASMIRHISSCHLHGRKPRVLNSSDTRYSSERTAGAREATSAIAAASATKVGEVDIWKISSISTTPLNQTASPPSELEVAELFCIDFFVFSIFAYFGTIH